MNDFNHTLTKFNGVDVPESVQTKIMALLAPYNPDIESIPCDSEGFTYTRSF